MTPGTAYVKYHHLIGSIGGHQGAWGFVRGGMGSIPKAIAAFDRQHGVEIATDSEVAEIEIQDGSATGVRTTDGRRYLPTSSSRTPIRPAPFSAWLANRTYRPRSRTG